MFGLCVAWISPVCSLSAFAQEAAPAAGPKIKIVYVPAVIFVDGAAIYEKPDFDAKVQEYLRYETKVFVSKRPFRGAGGMGLFHRIKYGGKFGYIPDTDVRVEEAAKVKVAPAQRKSGSKAWEKEEEKALGKEPLYFTRYLGGAVALVNFTEKFSGKRYSDDMLMYGLRMSGPGTLFDGPPLDFNFWFSLSKPGYYSKFSSSEPTGFMLFGDTMFQLPLIDAKTTLVTYGLGLMWTYTRYKVPVRGAVFDSQEFRIGLDAGLGVGQKIGNYMLRVDAKYYYEKTQYFGYLLSFQGVY